MTIRSIARAGLLAALVACAGLARASIVCDSFHRSVFAKDKYGVLAFVPVSAASAASATAASADAARAVFAENLKNKLHKFVGKIRDRTGDSGAAAMQLEPYVCNSTNAITDRQDLDTLVDRNAIGVVWPNAGEADAVDITVLVPSYASLRNLPDISDSTVEYPLPAGEPNVQWRQALDLEHPPFAGMFTFGLGMAYLQAQRYVAAKYSLCNSKVLISGYLKDAPDSDSSGVLRDIVARLDAGIATATGALATNKIAEPQAVYAMCAEAAAKR